MAKEQKTNVMRILEQHKIPYEALFYQCEEFIDGIHTAELTHAPVEKSFKTLVALGKSGSYHVFVIPIAMEVDLKKAARAVGEKSVEMIHVKDINQVTGYIRGGCSPIGMKKAFPTWVQQCAAEYDCIYISGGRIGCTVRLVPEDLFAVVPECAYADLVIS